MEKQAPALDKLFSGLLEDYSISGIMCAYREGTYIYGKFTFEGLVGNEFAAMCASVLGSAEGLGDTIGESRFTEIITELDDYMVIITGCENNMYLASIVSNTVSTGPIMEKMHEIGQKISEIVHN